MAASAPMKPWRAIPGGDGGVILYTVRGVWSTQAVADWTRFTVSMNRPELSRDDRAEDWLKWTLDRNEAISLAADLVQRQVPVAIAGGAFHKRMAEDVLRASSFGVVRGGIEGLGNVEPAMPTLYFMYAPGCPACHTMKPIVGSFYKQNRHRVKVVPVDLSRVEWRAKAWEPEVTPTLILRFPDGTLSEPLEGYEDGKPKETFKAWFLKAMRSHGA